MERSSASVAESRLQLLYLAERVTAAAR
jgi:hypothetical protein